MDLCSDPELPVELQRKPKGACPLFSVCINNAQSSRDLPSVKCVKLKEGESRDTVPYARQEGTYFIKLPESDRDLCIWDDTFEVPVLKDFGNALGSAAMFGKLQLSLASRMS